MAPLGSLGRAARPSTAPWWACQAIHPCPLTLLWPCSGHPLALEPTLDPDLPSELPRIEDIEALLDALELHREHPHTLALHDALYGMIVALREGAVGPGVELALADLQRAAGLEHPLRGRLLGHLGQASPEPQRSLQAILAAEPGVPLREDPLEALEDHLRQRRELVHLLEQRQDELVRNLERGRRHLELAVGAATLLFILAGLGWAVAFDWFSVADEPVVEEQDRDDEEPPRASGGRSDRSSKP
jgi:hypothetical protein